MTHPFLSLSPDPAHALRYILPLDERLCVGPPGKRFLFGGAGLASSVAAMEAASGRPAIWATAHYLSYARPGGDAQIDVRLCIEGKSITQARSTLMLGDEEILSATAALGARDSWDDQWPAPLDVPHWKDCAENPHWGAETGISGAFRFRVAHGQFADAPADKVRAADGRLALWMRPVDDEIAIDRVLLAVIADFVTPGLRNATGRRAGGNSLDNTIRYGRIVPTDWVLCDIQIELIHAGMFHGTMRIFADDGTLMAIASQSMILRVRD